MVLLQDMERLMGELFRDFERIPHLCGGALNLPDHISH
jgi:hypothetical protein